MQDRVVQYVDINPDKTGRGMFSGDRVFATEYTIDHKPGVGAWITAHADKTDLNDYDRTVFYPEHRIDEVGYR